MPMKTILSVKQNSPFSRFIPYLLLLLLSSLLGGCLTGQNKPSKISQNTTGLQLTGKFIWYDIFTADLSSAANFYNRLFGWSFEDVQGRQLQTIFLDGVPIGNAIEIDKERENNSGGQWLCYMSTPDVDTAVEVVKNNHGTVHTNAQELQDRGRVAIVRDPQGALFAVLHSSAGDPADGELKYSSWLGSELWTNNLEEAKRFYSKVAGYKEHLIPLSCGETYHFLMRDGKPRAGIAKIPWDDVKPNWIPYISVKNAAATTRQAVALGATLIMEPDSAFPENEVAILADPSGVVFGIQQVDLTPSPKGDSS